MNFSRRQYEQCVCLKMKTNGEYQTLFGSDDSEYELTPSQNFTDNSGLMFNEIYFYKVHFKNVLTMETFSVETQNRTKSARPTNVSFESTPDCMKIHWNHFMEGVLTNSESVVNYSVKLHSYIVDGYVYSSPAENYKITMDQEIKTVQGKEYEFNETYLPNRKYCFSIGTNVPGNETGPFEILWNGSTYNTMYPVEGPLEEI